VQILSVLLALLLMTGCSVSAQPLELQTIARGYNSGITERESVLITSSDEWADHWRRHASIFVPPPDPPPVDFASGAVVAVHLGERRTGGYSVRVADARLENGELKVTAVESRPAPGAITTQALTQPYHMVRLPRVAPGTRLRVDWQTAGAGPRL
jgi:hypothetical protein